MVRKGRRFVLGVAVASAAAVELGGCGGLRVETLGAGAGTGGSVSFAGTGGSSGGLGASGGRAGSGAGGKAGAGASGGRGGSGGSDAEGGMGPARAGETGNPSGGESGAPTCDPNGGEGCEAELPQLVAGSNHTCLLKRDGSVTCWGADTTAIDHGDYGDVVGGVSSPPASRFRSLVAGDASTCGITEGGSLECWGAVGSLPYPIEDGDDVRAVALSAYLRAVLLDDGTLLTPGGQDLNPLDGVFRQVSASAGAACALRTNGSLYCFGIGVTTHGLSAEPPGRFAHVTVGLHHACALAEDGTVVCWGDGALGQASPPSWQFLAIDAGAHHTCGLRTDHALVCWGDDTLDESSPPSGAFVSFAVGDNHGCALRADDTVACWGDDSAFQGSPPHELAGVGDGLSTISVAGSSWYRETSETSEWFRRGSVHACGLRPDRTLACFGSDGSGEATPPDGAFAMVSTGPGSSCALRENGELVCWGAALAQSAQRPTGTLIDLSVGFVYACAVRADQALACWQEGPPARFDETIVSVGVPPSGAFVRVSVGGATAFRSLDYSEELYHADACALDTSGDAHCWWGGGDRVEPGPFTEIRVGYRGVAALREDGSLSAWVSDRGAWSSIGPYVQVGAGDGFVCGRSASGSISCFDEMEARPAIPGTFIDFSVSGDYVCGVRASGNVACFYALKRDG